MKYKYTCKIRCFIFRNILFYVRKSFLTVLHQKDTILFGTKLSAVVIIIFSIIVFAIIVVIISVVVLVIVIIISVIIIF